MRISLLSIASVGAFRLLSDPLKTGTDIDAIKSEHKNATDSGVLRNDGFSFVDCVNDKMLVSGDKFGNPMSWDKDTPISVIRYDKVVDSVKQVEMTHEVCFHFCQKFENIKYFGIVNGNDCYCTTFFDTTAGDGGNCDVKCQGDASQLCGGPAKASVFEMHDCEPASVLNATQLARYESVAEELSAFSQSVGSCSKGMAAAGASLQKIGGVKGNKVAVVHQKEMIATYKALYAEIQALPFSATKRADALRTALSVYKQKTVAVGKGKGKAAGTLLPDQVRTIITQNLERAFTEAQEATPFVRDVYEKCDPTTGLASETNATDFHSPVGAHDASCNGEVIQPVQFVFSEKQCAALCRATLNPKTCIGYQFYSQSSDHDNKSICMRFATITDAMVYKPEDKKVCGNFVTGQCRIPVINEVLAKDIKQDFIHSCPADANPPLPKCPFEDKPDVPCQHLTTLTKGYSCDDPTVQHLCAKTCICKDPRFLAAHGE